MFYDEVNVPGMLALFGGMYVLVEAVCGICYMGSCLFSQSKKSMAFGGGLAVWFFLASMIGLFGSENMVNTGMGVEELSIFNKLTLVGLYDVNALSTVGTGQRDIPPFVWKLVVAAIANHLLVPLGRFDFPRKIYHYNSKKSGNRSQRLLLLSFACKIKGVCILLVFVIRRSLPVDTKKKDKTAKR